MLASCIVSDSVKHDDFGMPVVLCSVGQGAVA